MKKKSFFSRIWEHLTDTKPAKPAARETESSASAAEAKEADTSSSNPTESPTLTPQEVLKGLGVEIIEAGEDNYYLVGFQGGVFVFNFMSDCLIALFNDIADCTYEETVKAAIVANDINGDYSAWSCYMRTSRNGKTDKPVKICLSQLFSLRGDSHGTVEFIRSVLMNAFTVAREFRTRFEEASKNNQSLVDLLNKRDFVNKLELAKRLMEVENWDKIQEEKPSDSSLRIDALVDLFADTEFGAPLSMQVVADNVLEVITDATQVKQFNIREYIRKHPKCAELDAVTLMVAFEKQDLVIHLKKMQGSTPKSLFYQMNVMRSGVDTDRFHANHTSVSCRATVEIRLTTEQEDYWEVKYMVEDAADKYASHHESELTDEQKMLLIELRPTIQDDLYWGMKYYNKDCLFQSLYYLHRLYYNLTRLSPVYPEEERTLPDIALYIGVIYSRLKSYDRAYYYLDKAREKGSINAIEMYISCLCNLKDNSVIDFIQSNLKSVTRVMRDESRADQYYNFYLFLKRRLVQMFINEMRFTEAEDVLQQMVENGEEPEYALRKLAFIYKKLNLKKPKSTGQAKKESEPSASNTDDGNKDSSDESQHPATGSALRSEDTDEDMEISDEGHDKNDTESSEEATSPSASNQKDIDPLHQSSDEGISKQGNDSGKEPSSDDSLEDKSHQKK